MREASLVGYENQTTRSLLLEEDLTYLHFPDI